MDYIRLDIIIVAIYCYLETEIYKVLKFHMKNSSYSLFIFYLICHLQSIKNIVHRLIYID